MSSHPTTNSGMASATKTPANANVGQTEGEKPAALDAKGAIGHMFTADGPIGGTANTIGGPLAKDGIVGQNFNPDGAIGGMVQSAMGGTKESKPSN